MAPASLGQGRLRAALVTPFSLAAFALALLIPGASRRVRSFFWLGWPTRLPISQLWLERHGIRDLYAALYERDDLLILARPEYLPFLERDLQEHRGITVGHERVMEGETVSAFRLVRRSASR